MGFNYKSNQKMNKLVFLLFIFLFVSVFQLLADNEGKNEASSGSIVGRIVDEENLPLPGATVLVKDLHKGAVTDVNGFFRIGALDPGVYDVKVSYIGFKDVDNKVTVAAGKTSHFDFQLKAGVDIDEVVINGSLQGQSKALNQQKNRVNVANIISSDQVGRFPDQNVGDALKRIPGINVQYDQGEARFGIIRGTSPAYNSVSIDGDRIPSAEAETRSVQLDLIPSDMIQSIEVNKVVTPDMDADAIGGLVNLVIRSNPYTRRISGSVGSTYNALRNKVAPNFSFVYGERFFDNKLGVSLGASIQDHLMGSDDLEAEWAEGWKLKELQVRTYFIERLRQSYSGAADFSWNPNNSLEAKVMYNHRNDWENRYRVVYKDLNKDVATIERQIKGGTNKNARLEDQKIYHFSLGGKHQWGDLELKWKGTYSKANEDRPNERYLQYKIKKVEFNQEVSNPRQPQVIINTSSAQDFNEDWSFDELTEEQRYTEDIDKKFKVDFKFPFQNSTSVIRLGVKYKSKRKNRNNDFYNYTPVDELAFNNKAFDNTVVKTKTNFLAGDYFAGTYVDVKYLGGLDLSSNHFEKEIDLEELAGNFDASESVTAGYLRFDQSLGAFDVMAGVRLENTSIRYSGKELVLNEDGDVEDLLDTEEVSNSYTNVMPSLLLRYKLNKNTNIKVSVTNTLARPKYIDLVPRVEVNKEDSEIEIGNPELTPTTSLNVDFMVEHYFKTIGMVSGGVFFKDIDDFIVDGIKSDYEYLGRSWKKFSQPINAGDATLLGFEMAFQRQFDFLPGFLRQTGFYANYSYNKSTVNNFRVEGREDDKLTLPGTPEHTLNASLYYEGKKLSARVSYNYAADFIEEFSDKVFEDVYYDRVSYLDFNTGYHFSSKFMLYAECNNILNTPLRYYQGECQYTYQAEYYNVRINVGMKFTF